MEYVWGPGKTKGSQSWTLTFRNTESMKYKVDLLKIIILLRASESNCFVNFVQLRV